MDTQVPSLQRDIWGHVCIKSQVPLVLSYTGALFAAKMLTKAPKCVIICPFAPVMCAKMHICPPKWGNMCEIWVIMHDNSLDLSIFRLCKDTQLPHLILLIWRQILEVRAYLSEI